MMGLPVSAAASVSDTEPRRAQVRNSLIGNGFHLPCVMCLMCMLIAVCEAKPVVSRFCPSDQLASKVQRSLWEPGFLETFPLRLQFDRVYIPESVWTKVSRNLTQCNLWLPQAFFAFQRGRGKPWEVLPPVPLRARDRAQIFAGNSGQRYASDTSKGLDHLLKPGLGKGKEGHMAQAMELQSSFAAQSWPEDDVAFLAESIRVWGADLPVLAQKQRNILKTLARAVAPLQDALAKQCCVAATKVAGTKNAAFIAILTALLKWPDLEQAQSFILGFPIVGSVPASGVFRTLAEPLDDEGPDDWLQREGRAAGTLMLFSKSQKMRSRKAFAVLSCPLGRWA